MKLHCKVLTGTCCSCKIINNYLYPSHSNIGNIGNAHLYAWKTWCEPFSSTSLCLRTKPSTSLSVSCFSWAFCRWCDSSYFDFTRLFISFRVTLRQIVYQQGFFSQQAFRKVSVLSLPEFQVVLSILNLIFWIHETWLVSILYYMHSF